MSSKPDTIAHGSRSLPRIGEVICGKYQIERVLGSGGMGVVLEARHLQLDEFVAIKVLLPHVPVQGEPVVRFIREARAALKIRSEHVVRVFDIDRLPDGAPFIVMERLEGEDLGRVLKESGPFSEEAAIAIVLQVCEAIAAAHAVGIIHRDLKPANLFLTTGPDGRPFVKVLDFGISKIARSNSHESGITSTLMVMGTPCFMSPEQLRASRDVDERSDIWALGAILYSLLTGQPPYNGESNADVSAKIIRDEVVPLRAVRAELSSEVEAIVSKCLQKPANARYPRVLDLVVDLASLGGADGARALSHVTHLRTSSKSISSPRVTPVHAVVDGSDLTQTASAWGANRGRSDAEKLRNRKRSVAITSVAIALAFASAGLVGMWRKEIRIEHATIAASEPARQMESGRGASSDKPVVLETQPSELPEVDQSNAKPAQTEPKTQVVPASTRSPKVDTKSNTTIRKEHSKPPAGVATAPKELFGERE